MTVIKKVISIISKETGVDRKYIPVSVDFIEALHLNIHEEALLFIELEKHFNIIFPEEMMPQLHTVREVQKYICK